MDCNCNKNPTRITLRFNSCTTSCSSVLLAWISCTHQRRFISRPPMMESSRTWNGDMSQTGNIKWSAQFVQLRLRKPQKASFTLAIVKLDERVSRFDTVHVAATIHQPAIKKELAGLRSTPKSESDWWLLRDEDVDQVPSRASRSHEIVPSSSSSRSPSSSSLAFFLGGPCHRWSDLHGKSDPTRIKSTHSRRYIAFKKTRIGGSRLVFIGHSTQWQVEPIGASCFVIANNLHIKRLDQLYQRQVECRFCFGNILHVRWWGGWGQQTASGGSSIIVCELHATNSQRIPNQLE